MTKVLTVVVLFLFSWSCQVLGQSDCIDTDPVGDGWGWDGSSSCRIYENQTSNQASNTETAICVDTDPVGDGWGWNGSDSCRVGEDQATNQTGNTETASCVDTDPVGDGWGWNGSDSCRVGENLTATGNTATPTGTNSIDPTIADFSDQNVELCSQVNAYRNANGLPSIPLSPALMGVAQAKADDARYFFRGNFTDRSCSLHSWSTTEQWSGCCYDLDNPNAQCMWNKPTEVTADWGAPFTGYGFENAGGGSLTNADAVDGWANSVDHNAVILNLGPWTDTTWLSIGCSVATDATNPSVDYYFMWVSDTQDSLQISTPNMPDVTDPYGSIVGTWDLTITDRYPVYREFTSDGKFVDWLFQTEVLGFNADEQSNIIAFTDAELLSAGWTVEQIYSLRTTPLNCWHNAASGQLSYLGGDRYREATTSGTGNRGDRIVYISRDADKLSFYNVSRSSVGGFERCSAN